MLIPKVIVIAGGPVKLIPELVTLIEVIAPPDIVAVARAPKPLPPKNLFV